MVAARDVHGQTPHTKKEKRERDRAIPNQFQKAVKVLQGNQKHKYVRVTRGRHNTLKPSERWLALNDYVETRPTTKKKNLIQKLMDWIKKVSHK